jgi:hypothetical protein
MDVEWSSLQNKILSLQSEVDKTGVGMKTGCLIDPPTAQDEWWMVLAVLLFPPDQILPSTFVFFTHLC